MRKQSLLQTAAFEERLIPWLADILAQWSTEIAEHNTVRSDTIGFLDREVTRLFEKLEAHHLMDLPSSLLLQIDRNANILVGINQMLFGLTTEGQPNFTLPGEKGPTRFD